MYGSTVKLPKVNNIDVVTARQFDGGWNEIDSDLNLSSKYAKRLRNMFRAPDGSIQLRYGTKLHADFEPLGITSIVSKRYYNRFVVVVDASGLIGAYDGDGDAYIIFDTELAAKLTGAPLPWSDTPAASFAEFKGELTIHNGINKPLLVPSNLDVRYLQDLGTGSNLNTPIGKYACSHSNYLIIAGDPDRPSTLHISSKGTSGTFFGDAAPNDGLRFDLGSFVATGSSEITGVVSFRDKLVVSFEECIAIVDLGNYDSNDNHTPIVSDVVPNYGAISHHTMQALGDDVLFMDIVGVPSLARALIIGTLTPDRKSQVIDPAIQRELNGLSTNSLRDRVYGVINRRENQVMYFVPNDDLEERTIKRTGFMFTYLKKLRIEAWSELDGWNWSAAARTAEGRVFFARGGKIFRYGDKQDPVYADFVGDEETFDDDTAFSDGRGFSPVADADDSGVPISFDWILPWSDLKKRGLVKQSYYIGMDTIGNADFNISMFVDNLLYDPTDTGEPFTDGFLFDDGGGFDAESRFTPALTMEFKASDADAFGASEFGDVFGDGRNIGDERLFAWPAAFRIMKLRIHGETMKPLRCVSISLYVAKGGIRR